MIRQQSTETRAQAVWLDDDNGAPLLNASPTAVARRKDTGAVLTAPTVVELGDGFYRVEIPASTFDQLVLITAGQRRVPLEVQVGGYVDLINRAATANATPADITAATTPLATSAGLTAATDPLAKQATLTTRASQASVDNLGTPAQAAAVAALPSKADVASRASQPSVDALGSPAQAATVGSPLQASAGALLASKADVASRASQVSVDALGAPAQASALNTVNSTVADIRIRVQDLQAQVMGTALASQVAQLLVEVDALGSPLQTDDPRLNEIGGGGVSVQ